MPAPEICPNCGKKFVSRAATVPAAVKPYIGHELMYECVSCHADYRDADDGTGLSEAEIRKIAEAAVLEGDWSRVPKAVVRREAEKIVLTTSFQVAGRNIEREVEVLSSECFIDLGFFSTTLHGPDRLSEDDVDKSDSAWQNARRAVLADLRREALFLGADAVIAIDLDYQQIVTTGILLVASGTAVTLKPRENAPE